MPTNSKPALAPKTLRDARDARDASKKNSEEFKTMMRSTFKKYSATKKTRRKFATLLGLRPYKGKILASDAQARFSLMKELVTHVDEHQRHNVDQR